MSRFLLGVVVLIGVATVLVRQLRRRSRRVPLLCSAGKVALITGASSGIGEEISMQLADRGMELVLVSRTQANLEKVAEKCLKRGAKAVSILPTDVSDSSAVLTMANTLERDLMTGKKQLAMVVLNAGQGSITPFDAATPDRAVEMAQEMLNINYLANVRLFKLLVPIMETTNAGGDFLVMSSLGGVLPSALRSPYCAAKHAMQGYCNAVRVELAPKNIRVVTACPSFVQTAFHDTVVTADGSPVQRKGVSHFMTAERCAQISLKAVEDRDLEAIMTTSGWVGYRARPWIPDIVDSIAGKKAMSNVVLNGGKKDKKA